MALLDVDCTFQGGKEILRTFGNKSFSNRRGHDEHKKTHNKECLNKVELRSYLRHSAPSQKKVLRATSVSLQERAG